MAKTDNAISDMNEQQLIDYITELLDGSDIVYFDYEVIEAKSKTTTNTRFKSKRGWEVNKEDIWLE